jgi:hypothetical protein
MTTPSEGTPEVKTEAPAAKPVPGTPEYDAAMIAKFENKGVIGDANADDPQAKPAVKPAEKPVKPEGVPDKFWNAEKGEVDLIGLAKSYTELEKTRSQPKPEEKPAVPAVDAAKAKLESDLAALKAKPDAKPEDVQAAEKALADYKPAVPAPTKLDFTKVDAEFAEHGKLSDKTVEALEAAGFDRSRIDLHLRGLQALQREYSGKAFTAAGGEEKYNAMIAWAKTGLAEGERKAFDTAVMSGDDATMVLAVQGLTAKFAAANGSDPKLLGGTRPGAQSAGFRSTAEMKAAMRDPRYKSDPAYRADVENKLAVTTAF